MGDHYSHCRRIKMMVILLLLFLGSIQHSGAKPSDSNINMNNVKIKTKPGSQHANEQSDQIFQDNVIRDSNVDQRQNNPDIQGGDTWKWHMPFNWGRNIHDQVNVFEGRGNPRAGNEQNYQNILDNYVLLSDVNVLQNNPSWQGGDRYKFDAPIKLRPAIKLLLGEKGGEPSAGGEMGGEP